MISILCPLFNGIEFLNECLESINHQSFKDWECIIGLNGHKKNSYVENEAKTIVDKYCDKFILKVYKTKGKENTLNEMVKDTKYYFIALLDVDDKWCPDKLSCQLPYLGRFDVVSTNCKYFGSKNDSPRLPFGDITYTHDFMDYNPVINSSVIIRKDDAYWNDDFYGLDDYNLWITLRYIKKRSFYNIPEILTYHRIHNESSFNGKQDISKFKFYWSAKLDEISKDQKINII
jgi:glycosyltransferase involved in cell wall biosynthesis